MSEKIGAQNFVSLQVGGSSFDQCCNIVSYYVLVRNFFSPFFVLEHAQLFATFVLLFNVF